MQILRDSAEQLMLFAPERHAGISPSPEEELDWIRSVVNWPCNFSDLLAILMRDGWSGRMCAGCFRSMAEGTSGKLSVKPQSSGMAWHGEFLTLPVLECPNAVAESSLLDILETGDHLSRYCLSPGFCAGILNRAKKKKYRLPENLVATLTREATKAMRQ